MEISRSSFSSGLSTVQSGQRRVDEAAADIASNAVGQQPRPTSAPPANQVNPVPSSAEQNRPALAESLAELREGQIEVETGARLVKTADEVLGTLIDVKA